MKKNYLILFVIFSLSFLFTNKLYVFADQNANSGNYINDKNITISQKEFSNLINLGFNEEQIKNMDLNEFNYNKNLNGKLVTKNTKYFKTIYVYKFKNNDANLKNLYLNFNISNNINELINHNILILDKTYNEELSKDNYYNNLKTNEIFVTKDVNPSVVTTSYKVLSTSISYIQNIDKYRLQNNVTWNTMPYNRSYDVTGIRNNTFMSPVSESEHAKLYYTIKNNCYNTYTNSENNFNATTNANRWRRESAGYGVSFLLPSDTNVTYFWGGLGQPSTCPCVNPPAFGNSVIRKNEIVSLNSYMYYNVAKISSGTINVVDAFGSYQHSTSSISSNISLSFSINAGGLGAVLAFSGNNSSYFDGMGGTHAQILNANW